VVVALQFDGKGIVMRPDALRPAAAKAAAAGQRFGKARVRRDLRVLVSPRCGPIATRRHAAVRAGWHRDYRRDRHDPM